MSVVTRIKLQAKARGIKLCEIEEHFNYPQGTISKWNKKNRKPSAYQIKDIAQYLNTSTDYLLEMVDSPLPNKLSVKPSCKKLKLATLLLNTALSDAQVDIILDYLDKLINFSPSK